MEGCDVIGTLRRITNSSALQYVDGELTELDVKVDFARHREVE